MHTLGGYSAHADLADLLRFVMGMQRLPHELRIVHGDPEAKATLQAALAGRLPGAAVVVASG